MLCLEEKPALQSMHEQKVPPIQMVPAHCPLTNFFLEVQTNLPTTSTTERHRVQENLSMKALELCPQKDVDEDRCKLVMLIRMELLCGNPYLQVRQTQEPITRILLNKTNPWRSCWVCLWDTRPGPENKTLAWKMSAFTDLIFTVIIILPTNTYSMKRENSG